MASHILFLYAPCHFCPQALSLKFFHAFVTQTYETFGLRFSGKIVRATVSRVANKWFVSLSVEVDRPTMTCENQASIGVDLGVLNLATCFDGSTFLNVAGPKPLKKMLSKLRRAQHRLSRKQKGSNNRNKQRDIVAKLHARISYIRQDALHKLTTYLSRHYNRIVLEDLNIKGMLKNHRLSRSIADMGFYEFRRQLEYKAELYQTIVQLADRWYPSSKRCSHCGTIKKALNLHDRTFECGICGFKLDRDQNAAKNLYQLSVDKSLHETLGFSTASSAGFEACGEEGAGSSIVA